jgi:hypothetical protein
MIYFTKYANDKFDILNKHKVYFRKEEIEEVVAAPDKVSKKNNYFYARKEGIKVIYRKEDGAIKIITFFPVK